MRLIVCCDGTYNTPGQLDRGVLSPTNISKLDVAIKQEPSYNRSQKAKYFPGVGRGWAESIGVVWKLLNRLTFGLLDPAFGGASGWGLSRQVREAYTFLVNEYAEGDEIFIFGFSRGAFAARSLVGLIKHAGLLRRTSAARVRKVTKAYHRLLRAPRHGKLLESVRPEIHPGVRVRFLGVWDTVGALGTPIWGGNFSLNPLPVEPRYHDIDALDIVDEACQALAIDEQRAAYLPKLFSPRSGCEGCRIEQVWFRGAHSNVGGGYANSRLSDCALTWMVTRARSAGLKVKDSALHESSMTNGDVLRDSLGAFWLAGTWPRWFPTVSSSDEEGYECGWGYLHASVNRTDAVGEPLASERWLIDLAPGQWIDNVGVDASRFWNNTRVVLRKGGRYLIKAEDHPAPHGPACDPEGLGGAARISRAAGARKGELILAVNTPLEPLPQGKFWHALRYLCFRTPEPFASVLLPWSRLPSERDGRTIDPERTGVLHCFINSASVSQHWKSGHVALRIERLH